MNQKNEGIVVTQQLKALIDANPKLQDMKVQVQVHLNINHYKNQFNKAVEAGEPITEIIKAFYSLIDEILQGKPKEFKDSVQCKKGCSFCCQMNVDLSLEEGIVIKNYCKENNIPYDTDRLKRQLLIETHEDWLFSPDKRCVFLNEQEECNIYPVRPMRCRKYFVASAPPICDTVTNPKGEVAVLCDMDIEIILSALLTSVEKFGNMPTILLDNKI